MALCSSSSSISVPQPIANDTGVSSSVGVLLSFVFAHSAVAILVAEMRVDKALVPDGVCRMVSRLSRRLQCSLSSWRSSVRCAWYSGQENSRCLGVWGGCRGQVQFRDRYLSEGGWARHARK
jgi:hypothetical protein